MLLNDNQVFFSDISNSLNPPTDKNIWYDSTNNFLCFHVNNEWITNIISSTAPSGGVIVIPSGYKVFLTESYASYGTSQKATKFQIRNTSTFEVLQEINFNTFIGESGFVGNAELLTNNNAYVFFTNNQFNFIAIKYYYKKI